MAAAVATWAVKTTRIIHRRVMKHPALASFSDTAPPFRRVLLVVVLVLDEGIMVVVAIILIFIEEEAISENGEERP